MTVEQGNAARRLDLDNTPGSIKHLYVISAFSGDVLLYSTVDANVTSSGKRLSPYTVESAGSSRDGFPVKFEGYSGVYTTTEVLEDDGTYGPSVPYIYWWDVQGRYHQHYVTGGQIIHISDQAISVPKVVINLSE